MQVARVLGRDAGMGTECASLNAISGGARCGRGSVHVSFGNLTFNLNEPPWQCGSYPESRSGLPVPRSLGTRSRRILSRRCELEWAISGSGRARARGTGPAAASASHWLTVCTPPTQAASTNATPSRVSSHGPRLRPSNKPDLTFKFNATRPPGAYRPSQHSGNASTTSSSPGTLLPVTDILAVEDNSTAV